MMKARVRRAIREEKGNVLILVLILLVVGGLILGPLLGLMGTGLVSGQVYEKKTAELYAADAGVEDAIWRIMNRVPDGYPYSYPEPLVVNGKSVQVVIYREVIGAGCDKEFRYHILSAATGADGSATEVQAYVGGYLGYSGLMDNVITSREDYTLGGPTEVDPQEGEEHGPVRNYSGYWPTPEELSHWYWQDVKDEIPYPSDTLGVKTHAASGIGPLYRDGTLGIVNTGDKSLTLQLHGTLYVTGDTLIGTTSQNFTLDLNGNTIFVESDTTENQYALRIGGKCTLTGSGVIIAIGNVEFKPNMDSGGDDYILVMSVAGKTYMQPNGDFYGTLAGEAQVDVQNSELHWTDYSTIEGGFNFPMGPDDGSPITGLRIVSWQIG